TGRPPTERPGSRTLLNDRVGDLQRSPRDSNRATLASGLPMAQIRSPRTVVVGLSVMVRIRETPSAARCPATFAQRRRPGFPAHLSAGLTLRESIKLDCCIIRSVKSGAQATPPPFARMAADPLRWRLLRELSGSDRRVRELVTLTGRP